jgi:YgiT-type zinc finger domain-containing protein
MNSDVHDCSRCAGKMREGRHDVMAQVGDEIIVIKDVPALVCDTCGEVEYTLEVSREIDAIRKEFFAGMAAGQATGGGGGCVGAAADGVDGMNITYTPSVHRSWAKLRTFTACSRTTCRILLAQVRY